MERIAVWLSGPRHRVILLGAAMFMVPLLMPFGAALVAFATLLKGTREGLLSAVAAATVLAVVGLISGGQPVILFATAVLVLAAVVGAATLVGRSDSLDFAFQLGTLLLAGLAAVLATLPIGRQVAEAFAPEFAGLLTATGVPTDEARATAEAMSRLLFGLALGGMLISLSIAMLLGRWLEGLARPPQQIGGNFRALQAGRLVTLLASAVFIGAMFTAGFGALGNAALVFVMAMVLQGLAVVHGLATRYALHVGWLAVLYVLLLPWTPLSPFVLMGLATIGYLDNWFGFRTPRGGSPPPQKDI
jgi:hypothetical protein